MQKIPTYSLYLVTSHEYSAGRNTLEVAEAAIGGGIDILQLREKTLPRPELVSLGKKLSTLCKKSNIVFIANDDPELTVEIDADGVHFGQEDIKKYPIEKARALLGKDKLIGLSTHSLKEVEEANSLDINYIAFGPLFETKTKNYFLGTKDLNQALARSKFPVICIGGINLENIGQLLKLGATNIAVIREITQSRDITEKTRQLKTKLLEYKNASNR
ncbi:MAG: thiamine phosphate synthase [Candidatus Omnitrophota bacterium]